MDKERPQKYLICPVCFSLYRLDTLQEDGIIPCSHCEDVDTVLLEEFLYYSSMEGLSDLKSGFARSSHLDEDSKEFIVSNIEILIQLLEEFPYE